MKTREARRTVLLPARLHADAGWSDARIHNLSSQGALVAANDAPSRGTFIDLRVGPHTLIGCVAWRKERFFGVRLQGRIDVDAVAGAVRAPGKGSPDGPERRSRKRLAQEAAAAMRVQRSQDMVRVVRFSLTLAGVLTISLAAATGLHGLLSAPIAAVRGALDGHG